MSKIQPNSKVKFALRASPPGCIMQCRQGVGNHQEQAPLSPLSALLQSRLAEKGGRQQKGQSPAGPGDLRGERSAAGFGVLAEALGAENQEAINVLMYHAIYYAWEFKVNHVAAMVDCQSTDYLF